MPLRRGMALGQKIVPPFREVSSAPSEARSSLSAFVLGEQRGRGDARRSSRRSRPIGENSDYQISTPSPGFIRARRILTKRCRGAGAVLFAARRGAAMTARVRLHARGHALAWLWRRRHRRRRQRGPCCGSAAAPWARAARVARRRLGPASCRGGRGVDDALLSVTRESSPQIGALRRAVVAYVCCGVSQAFVQPFRAARSRRRRRGPTKQKAAAASG